MRRVKVHEDYGLTPGVTRIELVHTDDPYTRLKPGVRGTVNGSDEFSLWVKWDDGSSLGLIAESGDQWKVVTNE